MTDDRAVSIPIQYVLLLAIVALLSAGLFVSIGGFVQGEQANAARDALEVVGNRLATDVAAADRIAAPLDGNGTLVVAADTPAQVAGATYTITVVNGTEQGHSVLVLETVTPSVTVRMDVVTDVSLAPGSVSGGPLTVAYDPASDRLAVRHA